MDKLFDYIISNKRNTDIEELNCPKIDGEPNPLYEQYKNDKKALKPIIEFKKPLSFGKIEHSRHFLTNLCEDIEKHEDTREKNRLLKNENKHLRKFYKYMRNLLERQKLLLESDLIEDELVIQEKSVLNEEQYYIMFKKNIELTELTEKYEEYKKDMDKKFEDLEELYKKDYHKSFMCQEHLKEITYLKHELGKSKINEQTYKELFNEHKNRGDSFYNELEKLRLQKNDDIDITDKLAQTEAHKKEIKKTIDKFKSKNEKDLEKQENELRKLFDKELLEKDKMLQQVLVENANLRMSKSVNDDKD